MKVALYARVSTVQDVGMQVRELKEFCERRGWNRRARVTSTLQYWIKAGKLIAPKTKLRNGVAVRLWTAGDVEKARKLKGAPKRGPDPRKSKKSKV